MILMMSTLDERVTEAVRKSGVSVKKIADACGVSPQAIYQWMNGSSTKIMGEYLVEFAAITKHEALWIAKEKGPKTRVYAQTESQAHVLHAMQRSTLDQQKMVVDVVDSVLKHAPTKPEPEPETYGDPDYIRSAYEDADQSEQIRRKKE